jgi:hypothetical protein
MRWLITLPLVLLLGCAPTATSRPESSPTQALPSPGQPPPSPRPPITLQVDPSDFVSWGEGGGIEGGWSGIRLYGDGRVELSKGPTPSSERRIDPAQAARILQAAVDAGLLDLRDHPASGADMISRSIRAELDGHKVSVSKDEMTTDPAWDRVWTTLQLP